MENNLPKGWIECKLHDVVYITMGQSPDSSTYNLDRIGLPFFQGKAEFTELHPVVKKWCRKPLKVVDKNSVLLSVRAPVGTVNIADQKCCIGRGLTGLNLKYKSNNKFLFYLMQEIEEQLTSQSTGSTFESVSKTTVEEIIIPLPPLEEQTRIVDKLDALLARVNNCKTRLDKIPKLLKNFRQSVLAAAISGELTKEWREENMKAENGLTLLTKIKSERSKYLKKEKIYKAISEIELPDLPEIGRGVIGLTISTIPMILSNVDLLVVL